MKQTISVIAIAMMGFVAKTNAQTVKQTNVTPITNALSTVVKLEPVNFTYEKDWLQKLNLKPSQSGFNVDQLSQVNPKLVVNQSLNYNEGKNNNKTAVVQKVDYEVLIPMLVGSIKEQQQQIDALKAELSALKGKAAK
ncbi:tail fiber domain-containing protein [Pedobacter cryotolerans]|uniref:Tail fiber domain-containing protein n=1 Tax=Pedobacter cryotolerans TaxID=2571270 RepID=A0A4U1C7Z1_9SPHI|nr:tail fiber domain-containing protein [Pedobacter cryotolerans]TKC01708.1 tail fiber domain-containing protein [Pedobacter cryotolerans]